MVLSLIPRNSGLIRFSKTQRGAFLNTKINKSVSKSFNIYRKLKSFKAFSISI
jgi:hypothetical protein